MLRLVAKQQVDGNRLRLDAARRNIDVVVLTNDCAGMETQRTKARYLELDGWLVLAGDLFVRFTNPTNGPGPCAPIVQPLSGGQHSPYYVHVRDWPTIKDITVRGKPAYHSPVTFEIPGNIAANNQVPKRWSSGSGCPRSAHRKRP